jgi:hypothetical protein
MTFSKTCFFLLPAFFVILSGSKCQRNEAKEILKKIEFDPNTVDNNGRLGSDAAIDYEFCIPQEDAKLAEIRSIEPDVTVPLLAKGRIHCGENEWLCIVSTHDAKWKEKLYRIASLTFVKRIIQTDYE